jgi:peptidoglycan/xylan/chitin deacetylase (PgdA/CDA1 family)
MASAVSSSPLAVLMYHEVSDSLEGVPVGHRPYVLPTASFERQLQAMTAAGVRGTRLDAHLPAVGQTAPLSAQRCCVLTFDDGHESNYSKVMPLLETLRFQATFFVTTGWVGQRPYMTWAEIRGLVAAGMEVGSHSVSHRPPASLSREELERELRDSKKAIEDALGTRVLSASSPTGFTNVDMIPVAREAGYLALCFGHIGLWTDPAEAFGIPRIPVKRDTSAEHLRKLVLGDPGLIRRLRWTQVVRDGLKRALGVERYLALRKWLLHGRRAGR